MYTGKGLAPEKLIEEIKEANPGLKLFRYRVPNGKDEVIFQAMTWPIYKEILKMTQESAKAGTGIPLLEIHNKIFDECVFFPKVPGEEKETLPVGTLASIIKVIQEHSGFIDIDVANRIIGPDVVTVALGDYDWWGEPDHDTVARIKESCPLPVYRCRIAEWVFLIKPLTRSDINIAIASSDEALTTARAIVLWPTDVDWDRVPAGHIQILAEQGHAISGWNEKPIVEEV